MKLKNDEQKDLTEKYVKSFYNSIDMTIYQTHLKKTHS